MDRIDNEILWDEYRIWLKMGKVSSPPSLVGIDLSGRDLRGFDFSYMDVSSAIFDRTNLTAADFTGAKAIEASFNKAQMCKIKLQGTNLSGARLCNTDLSNALLGRANLSMSDCTNACFNGANMFHANCNNGSFNFASFEKVNLSFGLLQSGSFINASFVNSNLRNADFFDSLVQNADFTGADIVSINFCQSRLQGAKGYAKVNKDNIKNLLKLAKKVARNPNLILKPATNVFPRSIQELICSLDRSFGILLPIFGENTVACFLIPIPELTSLFDRPKELVNFLIDIDADGGVEISKKYL